MIKTTAKAALLLAALACAAAAAPSAPRGPGSGRGLEYEANERLFLRYRSFQPVAEATQRWQYDGQRLYRSVTLGGYQRVEKHLKLGAFYRLQYGARHDADWGPDYAGGPDWAWQDTSYRPESMLLLDVFPRVNLPFLPGKMWVGSMKTRFERNFFNNENLLRIEPELAYFWMDGLKPKATFFLRHETVLALNFGERRVWQRWHYAAALWHAKPWLSLGPTAALRDEVWSTSPIFAARVPGGSYATLYRAWLLGFTLVARLE